MIEVQEQTGDGRATKIMKTVAEVREFFQQFDDTLLDTEIYVGELEDLAGKEDQIEFERWLSGELSLKKLQSFNRGLMELVAKLRLAQKKRASRTERASRRDSRKGRK